MKSITSIGATVLSSRRAHPTPSCTNRSSLLMQHEHTLMITLLNCPYLAILTKDTQQQRFLHIDGMSFQLTTKLNMRSSRSMSGPTTFTDRESQVYQSWMLLSRSSPISFTCSKLSFRRFFPRIITPVIFSSI